MDKPLASALFTLCGVYLGGGLAMVLSYSALRAALAMSLIVAFSFALNDLQDVEADLSNKPNRPIPSGRISKRFGYICASALAVAGIAVASTLGVQIAVFAIVLTALSVCYSWRLKGTPLFGNGLVALLIASMLLFGALVAGNVTLAVWEGFVLTSLFAFSTEIIYTIRDEEADRKAGVRTVAVRLGRVRAFRVFELAALSFACLSVLLWLLGFASRAYLLAALVCVVLPVVLTVVFTRRGSQRDVQIATLLMRRISL
ncbi:MAG: UbiA family prenyltransferase, partial [Chloroflexota bacterium]|nr:UbiA family prenyltransferase [Chloroflexota bacterium]